MKKLTIFLLFCYFGFISVQAQSIQLPNACKKLLDKNFRGWKIAEVSKETTDYHKKRNFPFKPNLIKADWNGDGKTDYAVLIEQGKLRNSQGKIIGNRRLTIAFVKSRDGFKHFQIDGGDYIQVFKKGEKDYNYDSQKDFIYKNDSIFVGIDCCGSSYIWQKNKFIGFVTSD
ncbi:hypothetical protein BH20ACI1_BH20ACI1_24590 [soil metagenome]